MVFLSESHLDDDKADEVRRKLGFEVAHVVGSNGRPGGVVLLCNNVNKEVLNYMSVNFIDVVLLNDDDEVNWRLTGFYGYPSWEQRQLSCQYIRHSCCLTSHPWVLLGDFNEIIAYEEKEGGNQRPF